MPEVVKSASAKKACVRCLELLAATVESGSEQDTPALRTVSVAGSVVLFGRRSLMGSLSRQHVQYVTDRSCAHIPSSLAVLRSTASRALSEIQLQRRSLCAAGRSDIRDGFTCLRMSRSSTLFDVCDNTLNLRVSAPQSLSPWT